MSWRIRLALMITGLVFAACGNLSNEDLLFEAALPDKALELSPPSNSGTSSQALGTGWALQTGVANTAASKVNVFVDQVLNHLRAISAHAPTSRTTGHRGWSPVRIASTGLYARLTMDEVTDVSCDVAFSSLPADAKQYRWTIEVSQHRDSGFQGMITGESRGLEFSHSCGRVTVNASAARGLGITYTDSSLAPILSVTEAWQRDGDEAVLRVTVKTDGTSSSYLDDQLEYLFRRAADGSGLFHFGVRDDVRGQGVEQFEAVLQWAPMAQPWRVDFCVDPASGNTVCGTACGPEAHDRTYLTDDASGFTEGSPTACGMLAHEDPQATSN